MQHFDIPTPEDFRALAVVKGRPCVSIYVPTSPLAEHASSNRMAFKDLAKAALTQLREARIDKHQTAEFEERFDRLGGRVQESLDDNKFKIRQHATPIDEVGMFWKAQALGLGLLATAETMRTFRLPRQPKPLAEVADRFHVTPLVKAMTIPHEILVLALSLETVGLVRAWVNLPPEKIEVADLPRNAKEATDRPSVHVRAPRRRLQNLEGQKVLLEKYVRAVDRALHPFLHGLRTPMALAATEPLATMFREVCSYTNLLEEKLSVSPDHVSEAQLADAALPLLDRLLAREVVAALATYDALKPRSLSE